MSNLYDDEIIIPANSEKVIPHGGNYINVKSASDDFTLIYDTGSRFDASGNFEAKGIKFNSLRFKNETASDITVNFYYGNDSEVDLNNFELSGAINTQGGDSLSSGNPSVSTSTEIIAANADRTGWTIYNPSSAENLLIGPSGSEVYPVAPGAEKSGTGTYAIYGKYASETNTVPYLEEAIS
jgi:hypothetical protein